MTHVTVRPTRVRITSSGVQRITLDRTTVAAIRQGTRGATGATGPQGPQGTQGEPGLGAAYIHAQESAATTWTINHNLGYRPTVELYTAGGQEFDGAIEHTSLNQCVVTLNVARAGSARLI
jgi:hypothetical protein